MRSALFQTAISVASVLTLTACVTTQPQPDGSTKVHLLLGIPTTNKQETVQPTAVPPVKAAPAVVQAKPEQPSPVNAPSIRTTAFAGIFAKHPYDGTSKTHFPRAAVTLTDWSRSDCWVATATIWWTKSKSEAVPAFSVCPGQSLGFAINNAANLHLFIEQTAFEHSGNVRTTGPRPPMLATPDRPPIGERQQESYHGFIEQLVLDTGWQPGAPTNMWLVGFNANAASGTAATRSSSSEVVPPMDAKVRVQLEQALACTTVGKRFDQVESALQRVGWNFDQGIDPIKLPEPVKVFGLNARKIAVSRGGWLHTYRSFLPGITQQQVVKAASLKRGKDGTSYGRVTKLGVLEVGVEDGETTLTCTVDVEGGEG